MSAIRKSTIRVFSSLLTLLICYVLLATPAYAAKDELSLSPIASTLNTLAGQKLNVEFTLTNKGPSYFVNTSVAELIDDQIVEQNDKFDAATWVKVNVARQELLTDVATVFKVEVNVPRDATPGSHKVLVILTPDTAATNSSIGASVIGAVSYAITLNVVAAAPKETVAVNTTLPAFTFQNSFKFSYALENKENVTVSPIGYLQLLNPSGVIVYQEVVNAEMKPLDNAEKILGEKVYNISINNLKDIGTYRLEFLGLDPAFQTSDITVKTILFIPWWLIVAGGLIGVILIALVITIKRKRQRSAKLVA